ncbi:TonB-dependent receptor [Billgrantia endophytica]|uniref:TonB-dependent receptor n=2 Tax=Billgrantia endophytica TaxID=2033802 RepID=A0A2N7TZL6_9GAMM|nr:TonB-dependent receptor [Halomonas endophytica]
MHEGHSLDSRRRQVSGIRVLCCITLLAMSPSGAWAQGNAPGEGRDAAAAEAISTLPQVVVLGEKVDRSLFETSSSVAVYDWLAIESTPNATDVRDLLRLTPNVVDTGIGNDLPSVRGIDGSGPAQGANAFLNGTRPRLNLSIDGRSLTYNEQAFGPQSLWDMEQIEVFRGPQSHIQGRNAIAGAIVMTSKDPTFHWEGAVKGGIGEQDTSQTAAMLSGPIVEDQVAFRISVDQQRRDSFVDLMSYDPVGDPREIETTTARGKLLIEPGDLPQLSTQLGVSHYASRAPQNEALSPPPPYASPRFDPRRPVFETEHTSGIWDLAWEFNDNLSFENTLIYTDFSNDRLTALELPYARIDGSEFQTEPLIRFRAQDGRLRGMTGLRYFHGTQDEFVNIFGGSEFDDKTETFSFFAEATYEVVPDIDVTLSGRFEREHRDRQGGSQTVEIDFDETYTAFLPKLDVAWKPEEGQTYGAMVSRGYNAGGAGMTFIAPVINYTYDPEYVWSYELYSRNRLADDRLELTANLFFNDYQDMQLPYYLGPNSTMIRNADKAQTYGAEVGARWMPMSELELFGSAGLLKTEISRFGDSGIEGNELPRAPAYTATAGAAYYFASNVDISGNVRYSDAYHSQVDNDPRGRIPSYWVANLQLGYNFNGGRATLFAQNLFDSDDRLMVIDNDVTTAIVQQPRVIGASLELTF